MKLLDLQGKEIKVGDKIAYPLTVGRSANMGIYEVLSIDWNGRKDQVRIKGTYEWKEVEVPTVRAKLLRASYAEQRSKDSTLLYAHERAVLLKGD